MEERVPEAKGPRRQEGPPKKKTCIIIGIVIFGIWFFKCITMYLDFRMKRYESTLTSLFFWVWFGLINFITLAVNLYDKCIVLLDRDFWRIPEKYLHFASFLGGAPATAMAMLVINHKSIKLSYQVTYMKTCFFHICLVLCLFVLI